MDPEITGTFAVALHRAPVPRGTAARHAAARGLARELHDTVVPRLTAGVLRLELLKRDADPTPPVRAEIDAIQRLTTEALSDLRDLIYGLRESDARGIDVEHLLRTAVLPEFEAATGIYVRLHVDSRWPHPTPPGLAQAIVRIVQEALNNVRWHSRARAVSVALSVRGELRVMVADDGVGFRMPAAEPAGFGLLGMHERALLAGGSSSISRRRPRGTVVRARFPMPS